MKRLPEELASKLLAVESTGGDQPRRQRDDAAQMADMPRATLYYYFSGKQDLIGFFLSDKLNRASEAAQKPSPRKESNGWSEPSVR